MIQDAALSSQLQQYPGRRRIFPRWQVHTALQAQASVGPSPSCTRVLRCEPVAFRDIEMRLCVSFPRYFHKNTTTASAS